MDTKKIIASLHALERKLLPLLSQYGEVHTLVKASSLKEVEVLRALQWLENKTLVSVSAEPRQLLSLDKNGKAYAEQGFPERRFLNALGDKELSLQQVEKKAGIAHDEVNICLGILQRSAAIVLKKEKELKVKLTDHGKQLLTRELPEERLIKKIMPLDLNTLSSEERRATEDLKRRKQIIKIDIQKVRRAKLTELGKQILALGVTEEGVIDKLTTDMLKTGSWKNKTFRRYDASLGVPRTHGGKLQPYKQYLELVRQKFLELGFIECTGPVVEQEFWNNDALYMPQFHSARDIQDLYFIKEPLHTKLNPQLIKRVRAAHENGGGTGSTGWKYLFDEQKTQRNILRSHDTAVSPRTLTSPGLQVPGQYFQIERCFRHDVIDATHLPDFDQAGGFVIGEDLTIKHLFGLLRMFAKEFGGIEEIKIVPSYFPFTEPSCELHGKHPKLGWIELGGAGLFRPEMVKPLLGKEVPVIAWGIGISRLAMFSLGINDVRQLFSHDLDYLRNAKAVW